MATVKESELDAKSFLTNNLVSLTDLDNMEDLNYT